MDPVTDPVDQGTETAEAAAAPALQETFARLYGEPLTEIPKDLYIPPDALEVILEAFEGPLDLLLYLIRRQNFDILDIPMAEVTRQYLNYVEEIRSRNLELAAEYLLMAAMLIEIKSRMLLPVRPRDGDQEPEDPRAELVRRLLEYEQMKTAARQIDAFRSLAAMCWPPPSLSIRPWRPGCRTSMPRICGPHGMTSCAEPSLRPTITSRASRSRCVNTCRGF